MKARLPIKSQWAIIRDIVTHGWVDCHFAEGEAYKERHKMLRALKSFEAWLAGKFGFEPRKFSEKRKP